MEFSIQKVKRCGKSVLCPHRREAARVVFFTVFLPFLLLLLWGIFLYHSPRFFSVKLMGQTVFVSVFAVGTAAAAIFFLFFYQYVWFFHFDFIRAFDGNGFTSKSRYRHHLFHYAIGSRFSDDQCHSGFGIG